MNFMGKFFPITVLLLIILIDTCFAQDELLSRIPKLQENARLSNGGAKGCGIGTITLLTSRGEIKAKSNLNPIHVFGNKIVINDLLPLLKARVEANRTGKSNPMSGEVSDLVYVVLLTFAKSQDPIVIPVVATLLEDKDEVIRGWSAIALFRLGESSEELRQIIEKITFPKAAVQSANSRDIATPVWAKVKDDS